MFESAPPALSAGLLPAERRRAAPSHNRPGPPAGSEAFQLISRFFVQREAGGRPSIAAGKRTKEEKSALRRRHTAPPTGAARRCLKAAVQRDGSLNAAESEKRMKEEKRKEVFQKKKGDRRVAGPQSVRSKTPGHVPYGNVIPLPQSLRQPQADISRYRIQRADPSRGLRAEPSGRSTADHTQPGQQQIPSSKKYRKSGHRTGCG